MPIETDSHPWRDPIQAPTPTHGTALACRQGLMAADHVLGSTVGLGALPSMAGAPLTSRRGPLRFGRLRRLRHGVRRVTVCPSRPTAGVRRRTRRRRGFLGFSPNSMARSRLRLNVASCKANSSQKYHWSTWSNTRRSSAVKASPASRVRNASPSSWLSCTCSGASSQAAPLRAITCITHAGSTGVSGVADSVGDVKQARGTAAVTALRG